MGKLTVAEADRLVESGVITTDVREKMESDGVISSKRATTSYKFKTADGKTVIPRIYFEGGNKVTWSKKMTEFHNKVNELIREYGTEIKKGSDQ